jgi:hypothetical protein
MTKKSKQPPYPSDEHGRYFPNPPNQEGKEDEKQDAEQGKRPFGAGAGFAFGVVFFQQFHVAAIGFVAKIEQVAYNRNNAHDGIKGDIAHHANHEQRPCTAFYHCPHQNARYDKTRYISQVWHKTNDAV